MAKIEKIIVSETQAAKMLNYKNAGRFRTQCVKTGLIKPSYLPGKKYPVYSIREVEEILTKTKEVEEVFEQTKETDNSRLIKKILGDR